MTLGDLTTLVLRSFFSEIFKRCLAFYGRIDATAFTSISALYLTPPLLLLPTPSPIFSAEDSCQDGAALVQSRALFDAGLR